MRSFCPSVLCLCLPDYDIFAVKGIAKIVSFISTMESLPKEALSNFAVMDAARWGTKSISAVY